MKLRIPKQRTGRDRIFILVMALIVANLTVWLIVTLIGLFGNPASGWLWVMTVVDILAIVGSLWLIRNYRKARRISNV